MNIIIAGSRTFTNYSQLLQVMEGAVKAGDLGSRPTIISGTAAGADRLGERWAEDRGYEIIRMPADWDKHGRRAGYLRNVAMAEIADAVYIFWDGSSRGSQMMIDIARDRNLPLHITERTNS